MSQAKRSPLAQAVLDLDQASTEIMVIVIHGLPMDGERAQKLSDSIRAASQVLQRTLLRIKRISDEGATE